MLTTNNLEVQYHFLGHIFQAQPAVHCFAIRARVFRRYVHRKSLLASSVSKVTNWSRRFKDFNQLMAKQGSANGWKVSKGPSNDIDCAQWNRGRRD